MIDFKLENKLGIVNITRQIIWTFREMCATAAYNQVFTTVYVI